MAEAMIKREVKDPLVEFFQRSNWFKFPSRQAPGTWTYCLPPKTDHRVIIIHQLLLPKIL